jgi:hypothetical protein
METISLARICKDGAAESEQETHRVKGGPIDKKGCALLSWWVRGGGLECRLIDRPVAGTLAPAGRHPIPPHPTYTYTTAGCFLNFARAKTNEICPPFIFCEMAYFTAPTTHFPRPLISRRMRLPGYILICRVIYDEVCRLFWAFHGARHKLMTRVIWFNDYQFSIN